MKKLLVVKTLAFFAITLLITPLHSFEMKGEKLHTNEASGILAYDPTGDWDVEIEMQGQKMEGEIVISKNEKGEFKVVLVDTARDDSLELEKISFDEKKKKLTAEGNDSGITFEVVIEFDGNSLKGKMSAMGAEMTLTGERDEG